MQYFLVPFVLKNGTGEPGGTTYFFNLYIYKSFFTFQRMSYGATLAWMLFVITLVLTVALFASARRWVYYAGDRYAVATTTASVAAANRRQPAERSRPLAPRLRKGRQVIPVDAVATCAVAAFLAPMLQSASLSLKTREQITQLGSPLWPADPVRPSTYNGRNYDVYACRSTARHASWRWSSRVARSAGSSIPQHPELGKITWEGSWRALPRSWTFAPHFENFGKVWDLLEYPRLLFNTVLIAVVGHDRRARSRARSLPTDLLVSGFPAATCCSCC